MKASEAFAVSDRIARDVPGEISEAVICFDGGVKHFFGITTIRNCLLDEVDKYLKGDDWQPLYPAVDLSELPTQTFTTAFSKDGDSCTVDSLPFVMLSDLESVVPVKPCDCESKVRELESQLTVARGIQHDLRSELSTLREQSKRNCYTLGEPLTAMEEGTAYIAIANDNNRYTKPGTVDTGIWLSSSGCLTDCGWDYYLDPRPLPTLPEPEEPKTLWMVRWLDDCWHSHWTDDEKEAESLIAELGDESKATKQAYTVTPEEPKE